MIAFNVDNEQFKNLDSDAPDWGIIQEALSDVVEQADSEGVWCSKGNYQLHFWSEDENTIFCNAFVLSNPDDFNDSSVEPHFYYFQIEKV